MPTAQIPSEHDSPQPSPELPANRNRGGGGHRFDPRAYLETHELITLIDQIDDERARARFREAVYLAIILWLLLALGFVFLPRYLPHRPVLIVQDRNPHELTYLDTPPDLKDVLKAHPSPRISEHSANAQTPHPIKSPEPPEPRAGRSQPAAPKPAPQPAQPQPRASQPAPQQPSQPVQQPQQPQQTARNTPPPTPHPNVPPIVDAPAPSQQRQPDFNTSRSAGSAVADAARNARSAGGDAGDYGSTGRGKQGSGEAGVKIISDTQGVDFSRYLSRLLAEVRRNWLPLIPEECNSPLFKQGVSGVRFTIQPNGQITGLNLDYSTHDDAINRAAWGSLKSMGSAPPLPKEFHGPNLELRIEFRVNKDRDVQ